ncbi:MAG: hypothetical protein ACYS18_07760 [Planctomycetota bacterium]
MSLVRWFRKNNKKIMAIVVIVLLIGFIGGSYISRLGQRKSSGLGKTVALFADDRKITNYDLAMAHRELEVLTRLRTEDILRSMGVPLLRTPDFRAVMLGELLFSERSLSPQVIRVIKQTIRTNQYRISENQLNDIYMGKSAGSNLYWLLLKKEAELVGIAIPKEQAKNILTNTIPQLAQGITYSQLISSIMNQQGIAEDEILGIFGNLLAVLEYARAVCGSEDITNSQIMYNISRENELVDVELVRLNSSVFADAQNQPDREQLINHFDKYKEYFSGDLSEENPYGFGYKLPDRISLEYIIVKLDDISKIVTKPTQEDTENYYQKNREKFTVEVPQDPNDPNSPAITRIRSYAEVANILSSQLLQNKIRSKAEMILQEAKTLTEAGFEDIDDDPGSLSSEQFKEIAGDYKITTDELSKKYAVEVYSGQTGLFSAVDLQTDKNLGTLFQMGSGYNPISLTQITFAVDEVQASVLGPFDVPKPRMYENIGPLSDVFGKIMAVVRVVKAEKAAVPESIDLTFSKHSVELEPQQDQADEDNIYSVEENVTEDLKKLAAMDTAATKAEELVSLAEEDGWDAAIEKFNELYGKKESETAADTFKLESFPNLMRTSTETLNTIALQNQGTATSQQLINEQKKQGRLIEKLYSLVPQDANTIDEKPVITEFKPTMSYYCIKDISVKRINQQDYLQIKAVRAYKEYIVQSQSMAAVHFNPENILKRLNFRPAKQEREISDANTPAEPKENR